MINVLLFIFILTYTSLSRQHGVVMMWLEEIGQLLIEGIN